jgi:gamma-glutamyltranspeptidase/glutathione hydrolase
MKFDSRRSSVLSRKGMVATSHPLAASAGLRILQDGGNAVDAAIAAAAVLNVVEPMSTGIGGDAFALVWMHKEKQVRALNASGRAPMRASLDHLVNQGFSSIPPDTAWAVSVPGTVDGWQTLINECGTMSMGAVLKAAIEYAEEGFPVSEIIAHIWQGAYAKLAKRPSGHEFLVDGNAPEKGDVIRLPTLAKTLRAISEGGRDAFYKGQIAEDIARYVQEEGGWLSYEDLASHTSNWEEPIVTDYRGVRVWECPPNGQGLIALMALNIAEGWNLRFMGFQSPETYHHLIECIRLAVADGFHYIADPTVANVPTGMLLSKSYAQQRRSLIQEEKAISNLTYGDIQTLHDTVYVSCVDGDGNACSFMNSVLSAFGTGLVVPGTGIVLHDRAALFSLDPNHVNALAPGKRPFHTIIPGMATRDGELWLSFGVMGRFQQAQGQLQVLANMIDFDLDPQAALDALRFSVALDGTILLEDGVDSEVVRELKRRGHQVRIVSGYGRIAFGGGQIIEHNSKTGVLIGGSEPRKDGSAVGW